MTSTEALPSARSARERTVTPLEWVATAVFCWALISTTIDGFSASDGSISRTRELMTVYALVGVSLAAAPWRSWSTAVRVAVGASAAALVLGFSLWNAGVGSDLAINYWAQWLLAAGLLLLGITFGARCWRWWRRVIWVYGLVISVYQALALAVGMRVQADGADAPGFYSTRSISASLALVMVVGLAAVLDDPALKPSVRNAVAVWLGFSVVIAQHRSGWASLLVVLVSVAVRALAGRWALSRWWSVLATAGLFVAAAVLPLLTRASILPGSGSGGSALPDSFESGVTMQWRLDMWESRMAQSRSPLEWLLGGVSGPTPAWGPDSTVMNASISSHSMFVDLVTMLGWLALAAFVGLVVLGLTPARGSFGDVKVSLLALLAFGVFYAWPSWCWSVLGVAVAMRLSPKTVP